MKELLKSPFLHFLAIGAGIFLLYGWLNKDANHPDGYSIHISEERQVQMAIAHERNFGNLPDSIIMQKLIAAEVKAEIYYREALRLGLDENDEIIRRRLKQKYEFINKDNNAVEDPSDSELNEFYDTRKSQYLKPTKFSFDHYYFDPDRRSDPKSTAEAFVHNPSLSNDPFHISSPKTRKSLNEIRNEFGLSFAQAIENLEVDKLQVITSGFGYHVVRITDITPSIPIPKENIKDQLTSDYRSFVIEERNMEAYQELKKIYTVDVEEIK